MRFKHHKDKWWTEPSIKPPQIKIPKRVRESDPLESDWKMPAPSRVGRFAPSRKWARYTSLKALDAGYIAPLYSLHQIGKRYGLSDTGERYFRRELLPEPFDVVRIRSVSAHHWSLFTLLALDVVLRDLESRGINQFLSRHHDHIELLHKGDEFLHQYYAHKFETQAVEPLDKFGVEWLE